MALFQAVLLGVVQGVTEFLPVSSSGHLVLIRSFFTGFRPPGISYEVLLHGATLIVILIFYRRRILDILRGVFSGKGGAERRYVVLLVIGVIPVAVVGILFESQIEVFFGSATIVGVMWLVTALFLFVGHAARSDERGIGDLTWRDALLVGCAQALAIVPGISRSGATISVALLLKIRGSAAAEFSFLIAVPAILGALILGAGDIGSIMSGPYICGAVAAFLSGLLAIYLLLGALRQRKMIYFAFYCLVIGVVALVLR